MPVQVDHLMAGRWIRLSQPVIDADGHAFASDGMWRIDDIAADVTSMIVTFRLRSVGGEATMRLNLRAPDGPRLGRMRDWFEIVDPLADVPVEPDRRPAPILSALARELGSDDIETAAQRVRRLVAHRDYAGENRQGLAEQLEAAARELARVDRDRAAWLYERAIDTWYSWGAMATSGGDGAARAVRIDAARARYAAFVASRS